MVKGLTAALLVMVAVQQGAMAQAPSVAADEHACRWGWGWCPTDREMIVGGIVVAGAAAATALTAAPFGVEQAGEIAAGFLLSSVVSTAASFAVAGAVVYYYGPRLWRHLSPGEEPPRAAWQQYLDHWQQEIDWDRFDGLRQEIDWDRFDGLRQEIVGWPRQFGLIDQPPSRP